MVLAMMRIAILVVVLILSSQPGTVPKVFTAGSQKAFVSERGDLFIANKKGKFELQPGPINIDGLEPSR
jgi:hypothetical protein